MEKFYYASIHIRYDLLSNLSFLAGILFQYAIHGLFQQKRKKPMNSRYQDDFTKWLENNLSSQIQTIKIDFLWNNWKKKQHLFLQVKENMESLTPEELTILQKIKGELRKGSTSGYHGFHLVQLEATTPANGRIFVDGKEVSASQLHQFLAFEAPQEAYLDTDFTAATASHLLSQPPAAEEPETATSGTTKAISYEYMLSDFSNWLAQNKTLASSNGYTTTDIDHLVFDSLFENYLFLETKCQMKQVAFPQDSLLKMANNQIRRGGPSGYYGFHFVQFQCSSPEDGRIILDGVEVTASQLRQFLSFELPTESYKDTDFLGKSEYDLYDYSGLATTKETTKETLEFLASLMVDK